MFQRTVNLTPAPAVAGDFASANPRASVLAGPGGLVAGSAGVTVARFGWIDDDDVTVRSYGTQATAPHGFVHREQQALITTYLAEASNLIPAGLPVTLSNEGDYWALVTGSTAATRGATVYATYDTGAITIGSAATGASTTASIGATFTASGSGTNLTVSAVTGLISIGDTLGTVSGIPAGITIVSQTSGTTGGAGVYVTSVATTISASTATCFGTVLNVTAVGSGTVLVGAPVSSPSGAVISSQISGAIGGIGLYRLDTAATSYTASGTITTTGGVATAFKCGGNAAVGELVKITTWGD